ncbi:MAG: RnfABCDGE type electron transport complex subunit D [Bacteroidales bacterium]|nr:RnfABCDGE type electron transport complex subunit D [Bacteroidales bacterium]
MDNKLLQVSGAPHYHTGESTSNIMWSVVLALMPAFFVSVFYFGLPVLVITSVSVVSCLLFEYLIQRFLLKITPTISDGSAVVTGMLLAFNLPANIHWGIVILGALVAIGLAKMAFGGLGKNVFNPALVARVFLLISFPVQMNTWPKASPIWNFRFSDAITGPTPLGLVKNGLKNGENIDALMNSDLMPDYLQMLVGQMGGSFGEVSAIALLIGAVFLLIRQVISWHIPVSFLLSAFLFSGVFWWIDPTQFANPFFQILSGGMILGACFMATDMVTSPMTPKGMIVFGCGCGILTIVIRLFGAYPEGVSFAILIMNAVVPLINKWCTPKRFYSKRK